MTRQADLASDQRFYDDKAELYREARNPVLVEQVRACLPPGGRVLDVGCGSGRLLAELADRAGYRAGVELSPTAAEAAARVADEVVNLPVTGPLPFPPASFDVLVCADVLEHLPDPGATLASLLGFCRPAAAVVISVPNVAYWEARLRLLRGVWRYEPTGLFDSGHLRFLTRDSLLALLADCGLAVETMEPAELPDLAPHVLARVPAALRGVANRSWRVAGNRLARWRPTLFAYQLVCTARQSPWDAGRAS